MWFLTFLSSKLGRTLAGLLVLAAMMGTLMFLKGEIDKRDAKIKTLRDDLGALSTSYMTLTITRDYERATALEDTAAAEAACAARITEARETAARISRLLEKKNAETPDGADRPLIGAGELRDALGLGPKPGP